MPLSEEYLTGYIDVCFGTDRVELAHKVHGRYSYLELGEGDHIEVEGEQGYEMVTVNEVLKTIINKPSIKHSKSDVERSSYQGIKARVRINKETTARQELTAKLYTIRLIFKEVSSGFMSNEEAEQRLLRLEEDFED